MNVKVVQKNVQRVGDTKTTSTRKRKATKATSKVATKDKKAYTAQRKSVLKTWTEKKKAWRAENKSTLKSKTPAERKAFRKKFNAKLKKLESEFRKRFPATSKVDKRLLREMVSKLKKYKWKL